MDFSKKKVTVRDIAKHVGVHHSTVARALKNDKQISSTRRDEILKAADALGYQRNSLVNSLMQQLRQSQTHSYQPTIGLLIYFPKKIWYQGAAPKFYEGLLTEAKKLGFKTELFFLKEEKWTNKRLQQVLLTRNIQGIIPLTNPDEVRHLRLDWNHFCPLTISYSLLRPNMDRVSANNYQNMQLILRTCHRKGYKRIAYLWNLNTEQRVNKTGINAFLGYQETIPKKNRIPLSQSELTPQNLISIHQSYPVIRFDWPKIEKWLSQYQPDLIISDSIRCEQLYEKYHHQIPQCFGLASLDQKHHDHFPISGINQQFHQMGIVAARYLISKIEQNQLGLPDIPTSLQIEGTWIDGKTT